MAEWHKEVANNSTSDRFRGRPSRAGGETLAPAAPRQARRGPGPCCRRGPWRHCLRGHRLGPGGPGGEQCVRCAKSEPGLIESVAATGWRPHREGFGPPHLWRVFWSIPLCVCGLPAMAEPTLSPGALIGGDGEGEGTLARARLVTRVVRGHPGLGWSGAQIKNRSRKGEAVGRVPGLPSGSSFARAEESGGYR